MIQARRPAGTPVGGQFAPTHRPEAAGIELADAPEATGTTVPVGLDVNWDLLRRQKAHLLALAAPGSVVSGKEHLDGVISLLDDIQDQAAEVLGEQAVFGDHHEEDGRLHDADAEVGTCDECGAELVDEADLVVDQHAVWCSLHPGNVVDGPAGALPRADDPRIESSGELPVHLEAHLLRTGNAAANVATESADKLDRQHEALRGIQALLSDSQWDSPADRLEQIAMLIESAGYAHEDYRPEVGELIELQLEDCTVVGRIEWIGGDETLVVPSAGTRPVRLPTAAIEWDRDNQTWFHAPDDKGTG
ncbi:MAG: hypothetical protein M0010_15100 [Actinomycetota bacterium]|jgi:hypothetical protein|nr:hypothetical protein [Actinomycetota bacterium]